MVRASRGECWRAFRESVWGLLLILLVLGGIYSGLFTPTEAAAVAAVYAFIIAVFVYKGLKFTEVPAVLLKAASLSAINHGSRITSTDFCNKIGHKRTHAPQQIHATDLSIRGSERVRNADADLAIAAHRTAPGWNGKKASRMLGWRVSFGNL